ncbi:MAG: LAGLIDADG family homing endonuclease [Thermoproteota archaeon]
MGGGLREKQYENRFFQGKAIYRGKESEVFKTVKTFGKYEVRKAEDEGYELLKNGEVVGIFPEVKIEENRVLFKLSYGMNLEVSEREVREVLSPEKAELCGLIAADGSLPQRREKGIYEAQLTSKDKELAEIYTELSEKVYGITPHHYYMYRKTEREKERTYHRMSIYSKKVVEDLKSLEFKGPDPYEFHVPLKYLDDEGKRAFLKGFFSGDGSVSLSEGGRHAIYFYSECKEGLEELRKVLIDLGFHPSKICIDDREMVPKKYSGPTYEFSISEKEHIKFIDEIGSEREEHKLKFQIIRSINGEKRKRGEKE